MGFIVKTYTVVTKIGLRRNLLSLQVMGLIVKSYCRDLDFDLSMPN